MAGENVNRMPDGELTGNSAMRETPDRGVMSGVTDTYDSDLTTGYNKISETALPSPDHPRMEGC